MIESLTPEVFDALVIVNVLIGVLLAGRRFLKDVRGPLPDDAPDWARAASSSPQANSSRKDP